MRFSVIASILFFSVTISSATAQNFQPFKNKYKYQFSYTGLYMNRNQSELIHGIEIDSAKIINSDSVFYFNSLSTDFASTDNFLGNSMVKKANGKYLFLVTNYNKTDTVIIKTQETLGTQWTFKLSNTLYTAQYAGYKQENVLTNQIDFVKTFIVENTLGFKDSVKISENFGLIYSFRFCDNFFPCNHFNLTYILNTKTGTNKLNYFDYFNYDLGDVLVYQPNLTYPNLPPVGNDVYKVLSKTISLNGDTVTYLFNNCHIDAFNGGVYSTTQGYRTLIVTECSVIGNFPYTGPLSFPPNKYGEFYSFAPGMHNEGNLMIGPPLFFEAPFSQYSFQKNYGFGSYSYNGGMYHPNTSYSRVRYIKQSNIDDDCDNLEKILSTESPNASSANVLVAPNPFDGAFSLTVSDLTPGSWTVRIVSALGVEVYTSTLVISSSNQPIDLPGLTALNSGMYFLSLENEKQVYSQKIVKK